MAYDIKTGEQILIKDQIPGADGTWFDTKSKSLYIGELDAKKIMVFDCSSGLAKYVGEYAGLSNELTKLHMIDDLTVFSTSSNQDQTIILGADSTGRSIAKFSLDGTQYTAIVLPEGEDLQCPTSVRWGKGPGFDPRSIYVTEGGGATRRVTNRRVVQIKMD